MAGSNSVPMKMKFATVLSTILFLVVVPGAPGETPEGLKALAKAYPGAFQIAEDNSLIWPDGTKMPYHGPERPGKTPFETLLNTASLEEQMMQRSPVGKHSFDPPPLNSDPGRIRHEGFFLKMYGGILLRRFILMIVQIFRLF